MLGEEFDNVDEFANWAEEDGIKEILYDPEFSDEDSLFKSIFNRNKDFINIYRLDDIGHDFTRVDETRLCRNSEGLCYANLGSDINNKVGVIDRENLISFVRGRCGFAPNLILVMDKQDFLWDSASRYISGNSWYQISAPSRISFGILSKDTTGIAVSNRKSTLIQALTKTLFNGDFADRAFGADESEFYISDIVNLYASLWCKARIDRSPSQSVGRQEVHYVARYPTEHTPCP